MSFASKDYTAGQLNAMVKKMKQQFGEEAPMMFLRDELGLTTKENTQSRTEFTLKAVKRHRMTDCFQDKPDKGIKYYPNLFNYNLTPNDRQDHKGGEYVVKTLPENSSYLDVTQDVLGVGDRNISIEELQVKLIESGHCVEMKQIENEVERFASDTKDVFAKDRKNTLWFVNNYDDSVSVVSLHYCLSPGDLGWNVNIRKFGQMHEGSRYEAECRIIYRNSDNS